MRRQTLRAAVRMCQRWRLRPISRQQGASGRSWSAAETKKRASSSSRMSNNSEIMLATSSRSTQTSTSANNVIATMVPPCLVAPLASKETTRETAWTGAPLATLNDKISKVVAVGRVVTFKGHLVRPTAVTEVTGIETETETAGASASPVGSRERTAVSTASTPPTRRATRRCSRIRAQPRWTRDPGCVPSASPPRPLLPAVPQQMRPPPLCLPFQLLVCRRVRHLRWLRPETVRHLLTHVIFARVFYMSPCIVQFTLCVDFIQH